MPNFRNISVNGLAEHIGESQGRLKSLSRSVSSTGFADSGFARRRLSRSNDETACRMLLQTYLEDAGNESMLAVTSPERPELVPDMQMTNATGVPDLNVRSVAYQQSAHSIPIFGGRVVVDIDADEKTLVAINGKVAPLPDVPAVATLSADQAWRALLDLAANNQEPLDPSPAQTPVLNWHLDEETEDWHLVYHFKSIPLTPPKDEVPADLPWPAHRCVRGSLRSHHPFFDYFVDAHSGAIVFYFSSHPTLDIPVPMKGIDCFNQPQSFYGLQGQGKFFLIDPIRNIATYDLNFGDLDTNPAFPAQAIDHTTSDLGNTRPQAVSAHYHAQLVFDFFNNQLKRDGIDDKGMKLVSVVNVYSSTENPLPPPEWGNAVWWQGKMWYGQEGGESFAKHLDVIAHELTHGVTETSSNLIYRRLSGALNESFSDIFGVVIANWYPSQPNPISTWNWEIGPGLGATGGPIRNFADPAAAGQPDHMNQYRVLPISYDSGGVHIYSGIHNKAVHGLLTGTDAAGNLTFPTHELVLLLYLTLTRLTPTSVFTDSRRTLENVVNVYHSSDPATRATRLAAIATAFDAVGIT